ncbi:MAG: hypothetical protein PHH59_01820 [Methylovulum sp.]|uniref:hypothetical protein n=1 Tax=Methylovulum sp. TaxID=1916980 RepID=UPI00262EB6A2|nr:hypothetical protein [Methylovulum sp.]MDD2722747.1 hypothetical protein [Methylovulum sp.]MDD5125004.1 hypothetical protein [Methylovulum sp.]
MKSLLWIILLAGISGGVVSAAPREAGSGSAKIVNKLQTMVKEITGERDLLKTENAKVTTELEALKTQLKQDKEAATATQEKLTADLGTQKAASDEVQKRLDNTTAKLREVIEKYNALNKAKNELAITYANLQNTQQATSAELKACESKNIKMYEGAKEVIEGYQNCQKRGIMDTIIGTEPFSQIKDVEFETIMQGYEDKLRKQKYQTKAAAIPVASPVTQSPKPVPSQTAKPAAPTSSAPANPVKK